MFRVLFKTVTVYCRANICLVVHFGIMANYSKFKFYFNVALDFSFSLMSLRTFS